MSWNATNQNSALRFWFTRKTNYVPGLAANLYAMRTKVLLSAILLFCGLATSARAQDEVALRPDAPRFKIEVPDVVLTDVPVKRVIITAQLPDGTINDQFDGRPLIHGIKLTVDGQDTALPAFQNGVLILSTDLPSDQKVYIIDNEIVVDPEGKNHGYLYVPRIFRWVGLIPPMVAIVLAIWLHNVYVSLFAGVYSGAVILLHGNFFMGLLRTLDTYIVNELVQPESADNSHILIILFTLMLGSLIGVMSRSGSTEALVDKMASYITKREHGQLMTWFMGLVIFFDDYANTLLVGSTMRPVTDRLKISREKLAFLVDSTAAPIAGLAIISTWVGFEIGQIDKAFEELSVTYSKLNLEWDAYTAFWASIPYRFYPLHLIVFVWLIAYSGNDYGPMLKAEVNVAADLEGAVASEDEEASEIVSVNDELSSSPAKRKLIRNALIPLGALMALVALGMWWSGNEEITKLLQNGETQVERSFRNVFAHADGTKILFLASFMASITAIASVVVTRSLTMNESIEAWLAGAKTMFQPLVILVLAWGIATICDPEHLNTAGFLVELTHGKLSVAWMPTLVFILSAVVSFATGSSFSTIGLLMPLSISVTFNLLIPMNEANPSHHLLLATMGAVLAGAIFGDHCSPISDTTVLSSAATGCHHLDHVATQIPYAGTVALVSLLLGYVPIGFGVKYSYLLLPLGMIVLYVIVTFYGRPVEDLANLQREDYFEQQRILKEEQEKAAAAEAEEI